MSQSFQIYNGSGQLFLTHSPAVVQVCMFAKLLVVANRMMPELEFKRRCGTKVWNQLVQLRRGMHTLVYIVAWDGAVSYG